jgi:3-deoxy-manno-octulosonate cytidylyltransferase (CMP-KDO synthetase)
MIVSQTIALIPARLSSTRLVQKPLIEMQAKPLIVHVYERAKACGFFKAVFLIVEDQLLVDRLAEMGIQAFRSKGIYASGSERIAKAVLEEYADEITQIAGDFEWVVNLQGDEPSFAFDWVEALIARLMRGAGIATLITPIKADDLLIRSKVKVAKTQNLEPQALYFSRHPIGFHQHIGIYGFHRSKLALLLLPKAQLAIQEDLEQLTWLALGEKIDVVEVEGEHLSIDTPDDLKKWENQLKLTKYPT